MPPAPVTEKEDSPGLCASGRIFHFQAVLFLCGRGISVGAPRRPCLPFCTANRHEEWWLMSKRISLGAAISVAVIASAITVSLTYRYAMNSFNAKVADVNERQAMYTKISEIDQKARQDYVGKIDENELTDGICGGYLAGLGDPHAQYLSAKRYKAYLDSSNSKSVGVGIRTLQDPDGNMEIIEVMPGSPAESAGIRKGDTITAVNDGEVARITYAAALNELSGNAGTKVRLRLLRAAAAPLSSGSASAAAPEDISVTMGEYTEQTIRSFMIDGNAAYIRISQFGAGTASDFNSAISELVHRGAAGNEVDLRGKSGGKVDSAAAVLDTLLPAGNTDSSRDRSGKVTVEYASRSNEINLPGSVIVNDETSGAAEIFAADIRDFKKGLLVGEKTAGYGTKDAVVPLSDGSAMILSVAEYLTAGGTSFDGTGVSVDIGKGLAADQQSLLERDNLPAQDDPQAQAAVVALIRQGARIKQAPGASSEAPQQAPADND